MPKVLLTQAAKDAEREARLDKVLTASVAKYCATTGRKQYELAEKHGITKGAFSQWMRNFGRVGLKDIRRLAHEVCMSPEEGLQLGGFSQKQ